MEQKESNNNDGQQPTRQDPLSQNIAENEPLTYKPVYHHWFVQKENDGKVKWTPLSMIDSMALETAFTSQAYDASTVVSTDGGRFDVNISTRQRTSVYWQSPVGEVRRCSWFHKRNNDGKYIPYEEAVAVRLEEEYMEAFQTNNWHRKVQLDTGECVMFHGPDVLVLFPQATTPDAWGNNQDIFSDLEDKVNQTFRPRVVKRGLEDFEIEDGEPDKVDHLLFLVHGIGSVCDLKFRSVEEVVDDFRSVSLQLIQSHYRSSCEKKITNRVEVLPISWHEQLHDETGVDEKLKGITLESIPKLRDFANDTILDVLFYTSPVYCQTIVSSVGKELNRIFDLFKQRNPSFTGDVSLGGHSLGSLILFDILCHQQQIEVDNKAVSEPNTSTASDDKEKPEPKERRMSRRISYMMSAIGTGQPHISYPQLIFQPRNFFALGSPIGMFVTVRGLDTLGEKFELPTCEHFFNIFHPYDPVAYRIESLINPELATLKPVLISHHKGRKRMHLELKETMARVGSDIKTKVLDSMKATWLNFANFSVFKQAEEASLTLDATNSIREECSAPSGERLRQDSVDEYTQMMNSQQTNLPLGALNKGRRIDYVLQEAPLEFFNEYIFALTSHVCYWESEDTMLLILKEIYSSMNIQADSQIPQQTMSVSVERPLHSSSALVKTSQPTNGSSSASPPSPEPLY